MATISIRDVRKSYGRQEVIHGISIDIADGELCVLVGPSGCGKSTLLRMIAGLEQITSGTIEIDGRVVNRLEPRERDIAMVFQNYALYPHMSVFDNMAYGLKIAGKSKAEIRERVDRAAAMLQIEPYLSRRPRELSGGQRQRVAMGRALVRDPAAFLFDEPLSNLDAKLRIQMRVEIRNLQRRLGVTSVYVTHDQVEAMTLADMLVVMNNGIAEQVGTPLEIYERPASTFVASFIGAPAMNLISAETGKDGRELLVGGSAIRLPAAMPLPEAGRPVTLGIRPEHMEPASDGRAADLELTVSAVEILGADVLAHGEVGEQGAHSQTMIARLPGTARVEIGDRLPLTIDEGMVHLFDAETGRRIASDGQRQTSRPAPAPATA